jgi:hypothetical protein
LPSRKASLAARRTGAPTLLASMNGKKPVRADS